MFAIWQGTVRAEAVTEPFTIGIRVTGQNAGDYRVSVSSEGLTYEPGEIESLPAYIEFDAGQSGAQRVRAVQHRHRARRHGPRRALPQPVLPHLAECSATPAALVVRRLVDVRGRCPGRPGGASPRRGARAGRRCGPAGRSRAGSPRGIRGRTAQPPQTPAPLSGSRRPSTLRVHASDGLEQPQVRAAQALLVGDPDQHGRTRVAVLVHGVPERRARDRPRPAGRWTASRARSSQPSSDVGSFAAAATCRRAPRPGTDRRPR